MAKSRINTPSAAIAAWRGRLTRSVTPSAVPTRIIGTRRVHSAAHGVLRVLEADAQRGGEVAEREQRERERQRHQVGGERDGDQRRAEAGDAEDQRAGEGDGGEDGELGGIDHDVISRCCVERFIERRRGT